MHASPALTQATRAFLIASLLGSLVVAWGWGALTGGEANPFPSLLANRDLAAALYVSIAGVALAGILLPGRAAWLSRGLRRGVLPAAILLLVVAPHLDGFYEAFERDILVYLTTAQRLLDGHALYAEAWDHKPPAVHWAYAAAIWLLGPTPAAIAFLGLLTALVTLAGCAALGYRIGGPRGGWASALIWALASGDLALEANQPNTEALINAALVWAVALTPTFDTREPRVSWATAAGGLFLLATLFKPVVAVIPALIFAFEGIIALPLGRPQVRRLAVAALLPGMVMVVGWAGVAAGFALTGHLTAFHEAVFIYNREYANDLVGNLLTMLSPRNIQAILPYLPATLAGVAVLWWRRRGIPWPLLYVLFAYLFGAWVAVVLPGNFYSHYYQLVIPPIAVVCGGGAALVLRLGYRWAAGLIGILVALIIGMRGLQTLLPIDQVPIWKTRYHGLECLESRAIAPWINARLGPDGVLYHWGAEPGVYFWSGRPSPTRFAYAYPLVPTHTPRSGLWRGWSDGLIAELERVRPALIVANAGWMRGSDHPVEGWINEHYRPIEGPAGAQVFRFFERRTTEPANKGAESVTPDVTPQVDSPRTAP